MQRRPVLVVFVLEQVGPLEEQLLQNIDQHHLAAGLLDAGPGGGADLVHEVVAVAVDRERVQLLDLDEHAQHVQVPVVRAEVVRLRPRLPDQLRVQPQGILVQRALREQEVDGCVAAESAGSMEWSLLIHFDVEVAADVFEKLQYFY